MEQFFDADAFHAKQAEVNAVSEQWALGRLSKMLDMVSTLGVVDTGNLFRRLRYSLRLKYGEVDRISFGFPRYGIMIEKGVGRGHPIESVSGNGDALGERRPRKWFSPTMDDSSGVEELADALADIQADAVVNVVGLK